MPSDETHEPRISDLSRSVPLSKQLDALESGTLPEDAPGSVGELSLSEAAELERAIDALTKPLANEKKLGDSATAKLVALGVDLSQQTDNPDFIHDLPEHFTLPERVFVLDLILRELDIQGYDKPYEESKIEAHSIPRESGQDRVFRLAINILRNYVNDVAKDADEERKLAAQYAESILLRLIRAKPPVEGPIEDLEDSTELEPDSEEAKKIREAVAEARAMMPISQVQQEFMQMLATGNIEKIDWRLLPKGNIGTRGPLQFGEDISVPILDEDRAQNIMDIYNSFGGKIVTAEFTSARGVKQQYFGIVFEWPVEFDVDGDKITVPFEVAFLDRPLKTLTCRLSKNPNRGPNEPPIKVLLERGTLKPIEETHDAMYLLVSEFPEQGAPEEWKKVFGKGKSKGQTQVLGARQMNHIGDDRQKWIDRFLLEFQSEIDKAKQRLVENRNTESV